MIDSIKHQGQRKIMVDRLISKGIESVSVINALLKVPRNGCSEKDIKIKF